MTQQTPATGDQSAPAELVRRPHLQNFIDWSADKPEVLVLTADLTNSCEVGPWRDTYPERYFSMGMAEQNMMGFAAGLAREGYEPWLHTFAVFLYRRPLDQLLMSVAYPALPVRLIGFLPGVTTPGGVTHQAIDDIAVLRSVPNLTNLSTGDATEVESVLDVIHAQPGPVYVRMLRGEMPRLFPQDEPFALSRARELGPDPSAYEANHLLVLTEGICTEEAMRALPAVRQRGVQVRHLHISTLKPFNDQVVLDALAAAGGGVITLENHLRTGGLGSAVAEVMADAGIGTRLVRLGLDDTYAHGASQGHLMAEYGLDAAALVRAIEGLTGEPLGIGAEDLTQLRVADVHSAAKAEAL